MTGQKQIQISILIVVVVALICAGFVFWMRVLRKPAPANNLTNNQYEKQLKTEAGALIAKYTLEFPKFTVAGKLSAGSVPESVRAFVFDGAVSPRYNAVKYENSQKGFLVTYTMNNSKINDLWIKMPALALKESWSQVGGYSSIFFAFWEFKNLTSDEIARATFVQKDNSIRITVLILNKPKK